MADSVSFQIDIAANAGSAASAAAQLAALSDQLLATGAASEAASAALAEGQASFSASEAAANRAALNVERLGQSAIDLAAKMQAAMDAGDPQKFWKLAGAANALEEKLVSAAEKASSTKAALAAEGSALDALKAKADQAAKAHDHLGKSLDKAKTHAAAAAKAEAAAAEAAKGSGKVNELAQAFGRLGGPAGQAGQKVFGLADGLKKLTGAAGSAGPYIAIAVAIAAITIGAIAATVAVAKWGIELADAKRSATDVLKLSNQMKRFDKLIQETFGGLKTDALMKGLSTLIDLFDRSTASGKALAFLFESIFQPLIDLVAKLAPTIESFFLGMVIGALKLYIALKPVGKAISEFLGGLDGFVDLKTVGEYFFYAVAAAAVLAAVVGGVLVVAAATFIGILTTVIAVVMGVSAAFWFLVTHPKAALDALMGLLQSAAGWFTNIGGQMIDGLISGIMGGAGRLIAAVTGLAGSAVDAVKGALGISSPSKVFAQLGEHTAAGFSGGIEDSSAGTQSALESMVSPPPPPGKGPGGGGGGIQFGDIYVTGANAKEQAMDFVAQVRALLEGDALSIGATT